MSASEKNYSGYLIRLFNKPPDSLCFSPNYHFHVLGYYDGLIIQNVSELQSYYIHHKHEISSNNADEDDLFDFEEQRMCLYSPKSAEKTSAIFNYNYGKPFLMITEIKIGAANKQVTFSKIENLIYHKLSKVHGVDLELFSSLGFSDYVLVARLESFEHVNKMILMIRGMKINGINIHSTYSIAGFSKKIILDNGVVEEKIRASL